jgi:hypothetical protein
VNPVIFDVPPLILVRVIVVVPEEYVPPVIAAPTFVEAAI